MSKKKIYKSKTFWTGAAAVVASAAGYFTGEMALGPAMQTGFTGLLGMFLRTGMLKGGI